MDLLDLATGQPVSLDAGEADAAIRSGTHAVRKGAPVAIVRPGDENVYQATSADLGKWLSSGYRVASAEETSAYDARKRLAEEAEARKADPILAAGAAVKGFASGALLGDLWIPSAVAALDVASGNAPSFEAAKEERKAALARLAAEHPGAALGGELASFVAPMAGEALAARAASGGAVASRLAPIVAPMGEAAVVPKLIARAGEGGGALAEALAGADKATRLGRAAAGAARAVGQFEVENALIGAQMAGSDIALKSGAHPVTPEELGEAWAEHALPSALWGGAIVGALGGVGGALARGAAHAAEASAEDGSAIGRWLENTREAEAFRAMGAAPSDLLKFQEAEARVPGTKSRAVEILLHEIPAEVGREGVLARAMTTPSEMEPGVKALARKYGERIGEQVARLDEAAAATGVRMDVDAATAKLRERIADLDGLPGMRGVTKQLRRELVELEEHFGSSRAVAEKKAGLQEQLVQAERAAERVADDAYEATYLAKRERDALYKRIKDQAYHEVDAAFPTRSPHDPMALEKRAAAWERLQSAEAGFGGEVEKAELAAGRTKAERDAFVKRIKDQAWSEVDAAFPTKDAAGNDIYRTLEDRARLHDEVKRAVAAREAELFEDAGNASQLRRLTKRADTEARRFETFAAERDASVAAAREEYARADRAARASGALIEQPSDLGSRFGEALRAREAELFEASAADVQRVEKRLSAAVRSAEDKAEKAKARVDAVRRHLDELRPPEPSFQRLHEYRQKLDDRVYEATRGASPIAKELRQHRAAFEAQFIKDADRAADAIGGEFRAAYEADKQSYQAVKLIERSVTRGVGKEMSQGWLTKTDIAMGLLGGLGGAVSGVGTGLAWHAYRAHGAQIAAMMADGLLRGRLVRSAADANRARVATASRAMARGERTAAAASASAATVPEYERAAAMVREAAADPAVLERRIAGSVEQIAEHSPEAAQSLLDTARRAIDYLAQRLPEAPPMMAFGAQPSPMVAEADRDAFVHAARAVQDPAGVVERAAAGKAARAELEAIRAVFPAFVVAWRKQMAQELASLKDPPPLERVLQIEDVLGGWLAPSSRPENAAANQRAWQREIGGGGASGGGGSPAGSARGPSAGDVQRMVASRRTASQSVDL